MTRSIQLLLTLVLAVSLLGCSKSRSRATFEDRVQRCRNGYKAHDIASVVFPLFSKYATTPTRIPKEAIPDEVRALPLFEQDRQLIQVGFVGDDLSGVSFITGGGPGHWGIVVCLPNKEASVKQALGYRITPWERGVYFYRE